MKFPRKTLCTLAFLGMVIQGTAKQFLYLAARKDSALVSYEINPDSGALKKHYALKLQGTGGPMSLTRDGKYLYVESHLAIQGEKKPLPHVVSLKVDNGTFEQIHIARVRLRSPAIHVDNTGHNLLGAHYCAPGPLHLNRPVQPVCLRATYGAQCCLPVSSGCREG
jgi:6-phosphogluconolactonase (cycloisomerase 2 family)